MTTTRMPYILSEDGISILIDGSPVIIDKNDCNFNRIIQAVKEKDWDRIKGLADKASAIIEFSHGNLQIKDNHVFYKGEQVSGYVVDKILQFIKEGLDAEPLINFLEKLMLNTSKRCVDDLYSFLQYGNMPIDPDGDFYAYKAVRGDWTDKHTGTLLNKIGMTVEVERNRVDDDPANGCSHGLHAGSIKYVEGFAGSGDIMIIVKINPADVVSVPSHDTSKLRCCKYVVVEKYKEVLPDTTYDYENEYEECEHYDEFDEEYEQEDCGFEDYTK